jgi:hypothetical protein
MRQDNLETQLNQALLIEEVERSQLNDLTKIITDIMPKAPTDENSGPVEQGVSVYVDPGLTKMRIDVGDWFGSYDWFEDVVPKKLSNFDIEVDVTDEAGSPSWENKRIFPK